LESASVITLESAVSATSEAQVTGQPMDVTPRLPSGIIEIGSYGELQKLAIKNSQGAPPSPGPLKGGWC
jgi:hypothetical protein